MYSEQAEEQEFFCNYSNYNDINEDFDFFNQKKYFTEKMNIFDESEESLINEELNITQPFINIENFRPEHTNNNYYSNKRCDIIKIEAECFQGFGQISNQSIDGENEEKNENLDSQKFKMDKETSKEYVKENISCKKFWIIFMRIKKKREKNI